MSLAEKSLFNFMIFVFLFAAITLMLTGLAIYLEFQDPLNVGIFITVQLFLMPSILLFFGSIAFVVVKSLVYH